MQDVWKRRFVMGTGIGAGFALALAAIVGMWLWHLSRPSPPKPWNNKALRAEYYGVKTNSDKELQFQYVIENTTDSDYTVMQSSGIQSGAVLEDTKAFTGFGDNGIKLNLPVYIPAHKKTRIELTMPSYGFDQLSPSDKASLDEWHEYDRAVARHVNENLPNLNGFVIFDEANRYEIDMPGGWKESKK